MITALIIDDEADAREALKTAVQTYCPQVQLLGAFETPEAGIAAIRATQPHLVFLDVQMPRLSGFDVLQQLWQPRFAVIFVSAYDQYAIRAIRFSALDYLLKPLDVEELIHAVQRVQERLDGGSAVYQYQSILHNIPEGNGKIERLAVPSAEGIDFFTAADIIFCQAEGSYTRLYLRGGQTSLVCRNLKEFENLLAESGFCRVHHSSLINLAHVQKYVRGEGGYVLLTEGHHVDISRRKKEEFLAMLNKV